MSDHDLETPVKELVDRAIRIAQDAPEIFRVAVFSRVFDYFARHTQPESPERNVRTLNGIREKNGSDEPQTRKPRSSSGPKGFTTRLIDVGFFDQARTVDVVAEHISLNFGRSFASKDLSKTLLRHVRESRLRREKTDEGKLAYRKV